MMFDWLKGAIYIAWKDIRVYYLKAPNLTYGLMMPLALYLAFSVTGQLNPETLISGLVSLVILFGTMSIEAVAVVMEKQTRTIERLMAAPLPSVALVLGKAMAGAFFGPILGAFVLVPLTFLSGASIASPLLVLLAILVSGFTFSVLGVFVSSYARWTPEAQMYSNFLRFPMAFLAGTFVPLEELPGSLTVISRFLPLTYCIEALKEAMSHSFVSSVYLMDMGVLILTSALLVYISTLVLMRSFDQ
ncbi:ABC transporter permease [Candidatus Bathyarchaeota archaeon]|nr:MAG: ABC transporter permease [Candidatus Bathyarchaeota archaeon]